MKHILKNLFCVALISAVSFSLTSCGDDNDEPEYSSGKTGTITVKHENGAVDKKNAYNSFYEKQSSGGYWFKTGMIDIDDDSIIPYQFWSFYTDSPLVEGCEIQLYNINWERDISIIGDWSDWYDSDQKSGKVTVKSIKGNMVTLSFKNLKFDYQISKGYKDVIINGEITYPLDN